MNHGRQVVDARTDEALIAAFVRDRFVAMFLSQSRRAQWALLFAASLVALIWFRRTPGPAAPVWLATMAVATLLRHRFTQPWVEHRARLHATRRIAALLLANGVLMAVPLIAFERFSDLERAALSIILLASATASVATTSGHRRVFLAFAAPMLVPLAAAWAISAQGESGRAAAWGLGVLILLFLGFLIGIGQQASGVFEETCRFRHGEQWLTRDLKLALEEASEANRAKTHFLAAASHDLRQPIHSMNVLVAALTLRELDARTAEIVSLLATVNQTLSKQLDGLLDISKLDAGTVEPSISAQRIDRIVSVHHAMLTPVARDRGLTLELDAPHEVWSMTDPSLLSRALSNLTDNAFKFTPRGGSVRMSVRGEAGSVLLSVADTGIGISSDEHEQVFREFYQVGNIERDRSKGLGLGLSIVKRLCGLLNTGIALDSQPGRGTTITLRMPEAAAGAPQTERRSAPAMPKGLGVLVVDDEPFVRESMRLLLTELGCIVHLADGTEQARQIAERHTLHAVFSDFRLHGEDSGPLAIRAVLQRHPAARTALVTGDTAPSRLRDAQAAGIPLLHKPVMLRDLLSILQPRGD